MSSGKRNNIAQQQFSFFDCDRIINQLTKRAIESNLVGEENRKFVDVCVPQRHVKNARNLCDLLFIANRSSLGWMAGGPRNGPKINFECGFVIFARHRLDTDHKGEISFTFLLAFGGGKVSLRFRQLTLMRLKLFQKPLKM